MTLVRIALDVPGPAGNVRATGRVRATPTLRRTVGDAVVLPAPFSAVLVAGIATVELAPTAANWCWKIEEMTPAPATRYVTVPNSVSTLGYEDLTDVDPLTLAPAAEPEAAWSVALGSLDERVTVLEDAPSVTSSVVQAVIVTTGNEARPTGALLVVWRDKREDQTVAPVNIGADDLWVTEELIPPPSTAYSIYGAAAPTGSWTLGTDGTPYIVFARGFYKYNSSDPTNGLPNARVVGGRVWLPAAGTMPTEATFYLFGPNANLETTVVQTKVVAVPATPESTWVEATFDTPTSMGSDGAIWIIGVRFTGASDAGKYVFGTATRPNADAVVSTSGKHIAWAEQSGALAALSSQFRIGTGSATTPAEQTNSYGVDVLIDAGV